MKDRRRTYGADDLDYTAFDCYVYEFYENNVSEKYDLLKIDPINYDYTVLISSISSASPAALTNYKYEDSKIESSVNNEHLCFIPSNINIANLYLSHDGGNTWNIRSLSGDLGFYYDQGMRVHSSSDLKYIYVNDSKNTWRSEDYGETFSTIPELAGIIKYVNYQGKIAVSQSGKYVLFQNNYDLYYSNDYGETVAKINTPSFEYTDYEGISRSSYLSSIDIKDDGYVYVLVYWVTSSNSTYKILKISLSDLIYLSDQSSFRFTSISNQYYTELTEPLAMGQHKLVVSDDMNTIVTASMYSLDGFSGSWYGSILDGSNYIGISEELVPGNGSLLYGSFSRFINSFNGRDSVNLYNKCLIGSSYTSYNAYASISKGCKNLM